MKNAWVVLLNEHAGTAGQAEPLKAWTRARRHELVITESAADAEARACEAAQAGRTVVAAGGDGTVHAAAQGLLKADAPCPQLGVVPLGTGNDFTRSLQYPDALPEVLELFERGNTLPVDAAEVWLGDERRSFVNVASLGASGELAVELDTDAKLRWGTLAYVWAGLLKAAEASTHSLEITLDDLVVNTGEFLTVVIANGGYAGGGYRVAPEALLDDGLFEVHLIRDCSWVQRCELAGRLLAGSVDQSEVVENLRAREVKLRSERPIHLNLDGEAQGEIFNATFRVRSAALRVLVP